MIKSNCTRSGCKDVFHSFLLKTANYAGDLEIPTINPTYAKPNKIITFSKALHSNEYNQWVCFYEDDVNFERLWNNPKRYLPILERFNGIITPDFSLYCDMPLIMQIWNILRSRALGHWFQENGLNVIVNVRWGDHRTHFICCLGVPKHSTIAIGTLGCIKNNEVRALLLDGIDYVIKHLKPTAIILYSSFPNEISEKYKRQGITILRFDSETAKAFNGGNA